MRIARAGFCSRRKAEELIKELRVSVNGDVITELGFKVSPEDEIAVDGKRLEIAKNYTLVLNKPTGCITTLFDPQGRPTITQFLPNYGVQLKPVGRLDRETEGLLIVTNDGELSHRLAHPRYGVEKEYEAIVDGEIAEKELLKLQNGIYIEGGRTSPAKVDIVHFEPSKNTTLIKLVLHEGRKRQVRQMCEAVGHEVKKLKRTRYAFLRVKGMRPGECRLLGQTEINQLRQMVGLIT